MLASGPPLLPSRSPLSRRVCFRGLLYCYMFLFLIHSPIVVQVCCSNWMLKRILMEFIVAESWISSLLPCLFSLETPPAGDGDDRYPAPLPAKARPPLLWRLWDPYLHTSLSGWPVQSCVADICVPSHLINCRLRMICFVQVLFVNNSFVCPCRFWF